MNRLPVPSSGRGARAAGRALPIPLRPDPSAIREANVTSLVRACLATARAAARGGTITPADVGHDRGAMELVFKASVSPMMLSANFQSLAVDSGTRADRGSRQYE